MKTSFPKEKLNVLLAENISPEAAQVFRENGYGQVTLLSKAIPEEELLATIQNVHILGIRSKTNLSARVLDAADKLLAVGCFCIGTDQVDLAAATSKGIAVFNAPFSNTRSVAELTIGAAIMLMRRVPDKNRSAHAGIWQKDAAGSRELRGKTIGIIGYGNIGSQVSVLAESLGMYVVYYDAEKKLPLGNAEAMHSVVSVLERADIITLHVPSTPVTHHFINQEAIKHCKKGAVLINYSRGDVVDLDALKQALEESIISGAALDVYPLEPERNGDRFECILQNLPNVLLTPHIGGSTEEAQVNIGTDVSTKLVSFVESGNTQGSLTVPSLTLPVQANAHRILHIHRNVPGVLSEINTQLANNGINVLRQYLTTNDQIGYVVLDVDRSLSTEAQQLLKKVKETIKTRLLY